MEKKGKVQIQRGQAITFRLPSDTPDHLLKQLEKLKETEKRNFSSRIAEFALEGVGNSLAREKETITIPLPKQLTKEQRNWLKHSHSEAMLGTIVYQLLTDPLRASAILATLNSKALDIDEALYLQEEAVIQHGEKIAPETGSTFPIEEETTDSFEDDLMDFDWESARTDQIEEDEEAVPEETVDDLLGDFLANMNK